MAAKASTTHLVPMPSDSISRLNAALAGRYAIEGEVGQGGMATVYLAVDLKHERKVALKVLKAELAAVIGSERFLVEIKTTANLQHPHILPLHDSGEAAGFLFYVMPFIEGETLRGRLDREQQLPVQEAVRIAKDVAEGLHAAHEQGVIHRDIKPANILLSRGRPLVADFGIALAVSAAGGGRMTETGLSLGTPHYMSPEQATGEQTVGPTTDIYALGCVLYEMLVGEPPHTGSTAQAILGKIIAGKSTSARKLRASVPENVDAAIRKALERVPADRFLSALDLVRALGDPGFRHGEPDGAMGAAGVVEEGPWKRRAVAAALTAAVLVVVAAWGWLRPSPAAPLPAPLRAALLFPTDSGPSQGGLALSPDESQLAFVSEARLDGGRIWIRSLQHGGQRPLQGTEGAASPAWSPGGDRIAYRFEGSEVRVVPAEGGPVVVAADVPGGIGLPSWTPDGTVVFLTAEGIMTASEGGGPPVLLVPMPGVPVGNGIIEPLPDGRGFLLAHLGPNTEGVIVGDFGTKETRNLVPGAGHPRYQDGWLLYYRRGGPFFAQRFDLETRQLEGPQIPLLTRVETPGGRAQLAVGSRTLVFRARPEESPVPLVWVNGPDAEAFPEASFPGGWMRALSRDGSRLASGGFALWVSDTDGGLPRRIEGAGNHAFLPRWSDDARTLLYSGSDGLRAIGTMPGDSAVMIRPLEGATEIEGIGWGPEGEVLFIEFFEDGSSELRAMDADGAGGFRTVQPGATDAALSPDGRWLAYVLEQGSDGPQVFVRAYPGTQEVRVSTDGGVRPTWGPDGGEVYFVTRRGQAWRVSLSFQGRLSASVPEPVPFDGSVGRVWAHPDGRLLLDVSRLLGERLEVLRDWRSLGGS